MTDITDDMLAALTPAQRSELVQRLTGLARAEYEPSVLVRWLRRWFPRLVAGCCVLLVPWIATLALRLPVHYVTDQWRVVWVGFDLALLAALAWVALALWRGMPSAISATMVAATLLLSDAWFDVTTARAGADFTASLVSAFVIEVPLAVSLLILSARLRRFVLALARGEVPPG